MGINKMIWVKFQKSGFHNFPRASEDDELSDVQYLGHKHRHLFKFKVAIEIFHNDRELEFHQFLNWLESLFLGELDLNHKSCEMLSDDLAEIIMFKYPGRKLIIEVSEDGECGVRCEY